MSASAGRWASWCCRHQRVNPAKSLVYARWVFFALLRRRWASVAWRSSASRAWRASGAARWLWSSLSRRSDGGGRRRIGASALL